MGWFRLQYEFGGNTIQPIVTQFVLTALCFCQVVPSFGVPFLFLSILGIALYISSFRSNVNSSTTQSLHSPLPTSTRDTHFLLYVPQEPDHMPCAVSVAGSGFSFTPTPTAPLPLQGIVCELQGDVQYVSHPSGWRDCARMFWHHTQHLGHALKARVRDRPVTRSQSPFFTLGH